MTAPFQTVQSILLPGIVAKANVQIQGVGPLIVHPDTVLSLAAVAFSTFHVGDAERSLCLYNKLYCIHVRLYGENHPDTLTILDSIEFVRSRM